MSELNFIFPIKIVVLFLIGLGVAWVGLGLWMFGLYLLGAPWHDRFVLRPYSAAPQFARLARVVVIPLAVLRLPYIILPYFLRVILFFGFRFRIASNPARLWFEILRILGDILNWIVTSLMLLALGFAIGLPQAMVLPLLFAEAQRLWAEKGVMVWSGCWQMLPQRRIAVAFGRNALLAFSLRRYVQYFSCSDEERIAIVLKYLRHAASHDEYLRTRLDYVCDMRIVPNHMGLRSGRVRDIARGEIYVHRAWTNDPFLLIGQVLRRSPWIYDPRYLARPFYYRSQANPLVTEFVLRYACLAPPFAVFQFGHEIKAARYELFFRLARFVGRNIETFVNNEGVYEFDPLLHWLAARFEDAPRDEPSLPLMDESRIIAELTQRLERSKEMAAASIAKEFTLPLLYVEQILCEQVAARAKEGL